MIKVRNKSDCCGCRACEQICPKSCISIIADECGFLYPHIHEDICIECGRCQSVCPFVNFETNKDANRDVYALSHKNNSIIEKSSSGGAFFGIYEWGLNNGYKIYGVAFNSSFDVIYKSATTLDGCSVFRRSKYVQSNPVGVYKDIKCDLINGKKVIFSGTPCFVKALRNFLKHEDEKLILVDLICHGVPSPSIWKKYISFLEKKYNGKVEEINMRDKKYGWNHRSLTSVKIFRNKEICDTPASNTYMCGFGKEIFYRPSCYACKFATNDRPGDITIGDFWDIEKFTKTFEGIEGVSCCITNTEKGKVIVDAIKDDFIIERRDMSECLHPNLKHPTAINSKTNAFWMDWIRSGCDYNYIAHKYFNYSIKERLIYILKTNFPFIKNIKHFLQ